MSEVFGTIVAKPELPYARVLAKSLRRWHPDTPFLVLLADEVDDHFDPAAEPFGLLSLSQLPIPDSGRFCFLHERLPLSYASTPYFLSALLDRGFDKAIFVKQESLATGGQDAVRTALDESPIVLTPHLLAEPETPDAAERELNILLSGSFNGGIVGVRDRPTARSFLGWWADRIYDDCRHAVGNGMHYEQRWLDLVPAYFRDACILRDPASNVGHWNLPERRPRTARLLRFSGFDPEEPGRVTRYSDRLATHELGAAAPLVFSYADALRNAGWEEARSWPYAYDRFANGVAIAPLVRELYRELGDESARFGNPFLAGAGTFYAWLQEPVRPSRRITRLWMAVHGLRADLQDAFPDPLGTNEEAFAAWTSGSGVHEHGLDAAFLPREEA